MTITELKASIDACFVNCTESIEDKTNAFITNMDQLDQWRDQWMRAYQDALEDPNFDMSPGEFCRRYHRSQFQTAA